MSNQPALLAMDDMEGYPSLTALRDANAALLAQRRVGGESVDLLAAAEQFIRRGVATGVLLDTSEERRAAQSTLNYWANLLYRADRPPLDATLAEFDPLLAPKLPDELCPYLGLDAFSEDSAARFFGREALSSSMINRLSEHRLLALVGPSGSGKSSVVRAGLLPALQRGALAGSAEWLYPTPIVPGSDPLATLSQALGAEVAAAPLVLVVDQFEELFTLCDDPTSRHTFIVRLLALVNATEPQHRIILTMRSDFETYVARIPELQPAFERGRVQITPLSAAELREAIEAPAAQVGLKFEQGVVDLLIQDILGEPAGLPLLQFTLLKLWERRERNRVTHASYEQVGGGRLALARSADAFYQALIPEEQVTARRILLRMVRPGEGLEITSSRVRRTELLQGGEDPGRVARVLQKLIEARLMRLTPGETPDDNQIEIAHEALVRNWPTLVDWLEQEKTAIATRRRLESRAAEWARLGSDTAGLLDEVEWREATRWLQSTEAQELGYNAALVTFIAASRAVTEQAAHEQETARQRELEQARELAEVQSRLAEAQARTAQRLRRAAVALIVLLAAAIVTTFYALIQRSDANAQQSLAFTAEANAQSDARARATAQAQALREADIARTAEANARVAEATAQAAKSDADQQREIVDIQRLAFAARSQLDNAPEVALLLAYEAAKRAISPITERTLQDALDHYPTTVHVLQGHMSVVRTAAFSPDGQQIITGSDDHLAQVWDLKGHITVTLRGHTDRVQSAVFSPDGQRILTASYDGLAQVWDLAGKPIARLQGHSNRVESAMFSPDGQRIVTASDDRTARIWNLAGSSLASLQGHTATVRSAVFSPDGQRIVTASDDGTARVWDSAGNLLATLQGHTAPVRNAAFSPDGQRIVTASDDGTARIWNLAGSLLAILQGHTAVVSSATFSPDGQRIVTASYDNTARVWDLSGRSLATLQGHTFVVWNAMFSPDGQRILTASWDGTARVWDLTGKLLTVLQGHTEAVVGARFSPDGKQIVTVSDDHTARVWDFTSNQIATLLGHTSAVVSAIFSPDSQRVLTASDDRTARLWDLAGNLLTTLQGHTAAVRSASFSPDGLRIVTASDDNTARVSDLQGKLVAILQGHTAAVRSAVFSPDGLRIVTASDDGTARVWDSAGNLLAKLQGHTAAVRSAVFNPDGLRIVTASDDGTAQVWDSAGNLLAKLQGHTAAVVSANFSPDGQQIVTASFDKTARVWDISGTSLTILQGHRAYIWSAVFSPDGQRILTASDDYTAKLWNLAGQELATFQGHTSILHSAVFSQDRRHILTASSDATARIYLGQVDDLLAVAACRLPRGLTQEEIQRFEVGVPRFDFTTRQCPPVFLK